MKKRTYIYAVLCVMAILIVTVNCTDEELVKSPSLSQTDMKGFTLQEAKDFFEKKMMQGSTNTRTGGKMSKTSLSPQDFTPKWDNVVGSAQRNLAGYDISIETNTRYQVTSYDFKGGVARVSVVPVSQKLIIVKDVETEALGQYILTLIPTKDCYVKHKKNICDLFINCSDKACFSGVAIYTNPLNGRLVRVNRYIDGVKMQGVFIPGDMETLGQRVKVLRSILEGMTFRRMAVATTRFGEWDYGDGYPSLPPLPDHDDWNYGLGNYTDLGDGYFWDEDNNEILYDSDGDGKPDSVWIPPVDITPDTPGGTGQPEQPGVPGGTGGETVPPIGPGEPFDPGEGTDPVFPVDPDPIPDVCPLCGSIGCGGSCVGDLPQPTPPVVDEPVAPAVSDTIAKKLFRNSKMTEANWKTLNRMLRKIMNNCMGEALVNGLLKALNGKTLSIQINNEGYSAFIFGEGSAAGISLGMSMESNALFHEMWHAYQSYQEASQSSYVNAVVNLEIEAHYAQYQYLQSLSEYKLGSKWQIMYVKDDRMMSISDFDVYFDTKGNLLPHSTIDGAQKCMNNAVKAFKNDKAYKDYLYDKNRSLLSTFSNLRKLTKDC